MTKATLVILRHGQTKYNKKHLMTGQEDVPLTKEGERQAKEAGRLLNVFRFDHVYSSTLSRAFNTAALALEHSGNHEHLRDASGQWKIKKRYEIVEQHTGDFTGRCHKTDPEIVNWQRTYEVPLPGGESDWQVVDRVAAFYESEVLPRLKRGENVLIVAHAGVVRAFDVVLGVAKKPEKWEKKKVPNASPIVFDYSNGRITGFTCIENTAAGQLPKKARKKQPKPPRRKAA